MDNKWLYVEGIQAPYTMEFEQTDKVNRNFYNVLFAMEPGAIQRVDHIDNYIKDLIVYRSAIQPIGTIGVWVQMNVRSQRTRVLIMTEMHGRTKSATYNACKTFKTSPEFQTAIKSLKDQLDPKTTEHYEETETYIDIHNIITKLDKQIKELNIQKNCLLDKLKCAE